MHRNVTFQAVDPPVYAPYSSSDDMVTIWKVLWKNEWALSIAVDKTGQVDSDGSKFYVYTHWPALGSSVVGRYKHLEDAQECANARLVEFAAFMRRVWFLPGAVF